MVWVTEDQVGEVGQKQKVWFRSACADRQAALGVGQFPVHSRAFVPSCQKEAHQEHPATTSCSPGSRRPNQPHSLSHTSRSGPRRWSRNRRDRPQRLVSSQEILILVLSITLHKHSLKSYRQYSVLVSDVGNLSVTFASHGDSNFSDTHRSNWVVFRHLY